MPPNGWTSQTSRNKLILVPFSLDEVGSLVLGWPLDAEATSLNLPVLDLLAEFNDPKITFPVSVGTKISTRAQPHEPEPTSSGTQDLLRSGWLLEEVHHELFRFFFVESGS